MKAAWMLMSLFAATSLAQAPASFPERKVTRVGEFTVTASAGDEAYAQALVSALKTRKPQDRRPAPAIPFGLQQLGEQRTQLLSELAHELALEKPTREMTGNYDNLPRAYLLIYSKVAKSFPKQFAIWRRTEVKARLEAGQKIPGFSLNEAGEVLFSVNFAFHFKDESEIERALESIDRNLRDLIWPISVNEPATPQQDVEKGLGLYEDYAQAFAQNAPTTVAAVLHEAVESTLITEYIGSADRRWFCDGVANYLAMKVIQKRVGQDALRGYYDLDDQLARYASLAGKIDLESWPAVENNQDGKYPAYVNDANYAFATQVIVAITRKHGDDLIRRMLQEIGETPREKTDIKTVYAAFNKITGEDLRLYLPH